MRVRVVGITLDGLGNRLVEASGSFDGRVKRPQEMIQGGMPAAAQHDEAVA